MIDTQIISRELKSKNWTQEDLADRMGLSRRTVNGILAKGEIKKRKYLPLFAQTLGLPEERLLVNQSPLSELDRIAFEVRIQMLEQQLERERQEKTDLLERLLKIKPDN